MSTAVERRSVILVTLSLVAVALAWRLLLSARTPVPSEDGVSYVWMARQFARGEWRAPLGEVFPPLLSLLMAPASTLQIDASLVLRHVEAPASFGGDGSVHGSQLVLSLLGALSVLPIAWLARRAAGGAQCVCLLAAVLAALPSLPARYCAEVYTEPAFALVIAWAAGCGLRARPWQLGLWSGVAFWLRSEALLLPLAFVVLRPRTAWRAALPALGAVALLALWRGAAGHGFDPLPKLAFNLPKSAVGSEGWMAMVSSAATALPGAYFEAFGVAGALALLGVWRSRHNADLRPLALTLVLAVAVVLAFAVRRRFLVAWWPLVIAYAGVGLLDLPRSWRGLAVAAAVVLGVAGGWRTTERDRLAERAVGAHLHTVLHSGDEVVTDLTRVSYFAGRRPLPPRHRSADEMIAAAHAPRVRFLVLGSRRPTTAAVRDALPEFAPVELPAPIARLAAERGLDVLAR
ncbi:MAG: hypothetical protein R3F56_09615 [Planctomycetota bacterium]